MWRTLSEEKFKKKYHFPKKTFEDVIVMHQHAMTKELSKFGKFEEIDSIINDINIEEKLLSCLPERLDELRNIINDPFKVVSDYIVKNGDVKGWNYYYENHFKDAKETLHAIQKIKGLQL